MIFTWLSKAFATAKRWAAGVLPWVTLILFGLLARARLQAARARLALTKERQNVANEKDRESITESEALVAQDEIAREEASRLLDAALGERSNSRSGER